jgi:hypothetical protein
VSRSHVRVASRQLQRLIPMPWSLELFVDRIAEQRQRPISLQAIDLPTGCGISGAWKAGARRDFVLFDAKASGVRRDTIILHEISHMWLGHTPAELGFVGQEAVEVILPALQEASPDLVRKFMYRDGYDRAAEASAEYLATLIVSSIDHRELGDTAQHVRNSLW